MVDSDEKFMRLALREAVKGLGRTSPNPCVGAVVVRSGKLVGKGYHRKAGTPHAEVNALRDAGNKAKGATIYVTLEPCNHTGRTPPCAEAVLAAGVARVVIGMLDPNPQVAGGGAEYLATRGLDVVSGILEKECREINLPFIKHSSTGLPWVIMKAGMTLDGRIAAEPGKPTLITGAQARRRVHRLRDQVDAILVGIDTALADDPSLTCRMSGGRHGRDPLRVILDTGLRLPTDALMLTQESSAATWIFCGPKPDSVKSAALTAAGAYVKHVAVDKAGRLDLTAVLQELGKNGCTSVLVEGGSRVHGSFLAAGLVDQVFLFVAPFFLGSAGVPVAEFAGPGLDLSRRLKDLTTKRYGDDLLISGKL